ncbi:hypothetical protein [Streptomyces sp. NPDC087212]|uniref:hypothetical protein n=1 Tax=Streptomyces sp. NPDC087212 TaxID=3365766 RepID=UPI003811DBA9
MVAFVGGCDSGRTTVSPAVSPSVSASPVGSVAKAVLDQAFTGRQELASGAGALETRFGNALPAQDKKVLSVTFAFTCTGNAKVAFTFTVDGKNVPTATHTGTCDRSVIQQSLEIPAPGPVAFEADVTGSRSGAFAYAFYTEKKQIS